MLRATSFQLSPLHERRQTKRLKRCSASLFQLTTSQQICQQTISISTHDLTRRSTILDAGAEVLKYFNSRPREEVEAASGILNAKYLVFQLTISRRGRRLLLTNQSDAEIISTHDLTRRSTRVAFRKIGKSSLSTHDLARRSTLAIVRDEQVCYYFNSRPHEEVDLCTAKYRC